MKLTYTIAEMIAATGFSRTSIFEAIKNNEIETFKRGRRRFITHPALVDYVEKQAAEG